MGYQIIQLGTLYANGQVLDVIKDNAGAVTQWDGSSEVTFKDTVPGKAFQWVKPDGKNILAADRVLLNSISWNDLRDLSFTAGKAISIDGLPYRCRLLQVSINTSMPSEWEDILDITGDSKRLWHWKRNGFWCVDKDAASLQPSCGDGGIHKQDILPISYRQISVGFRPVLEILGCERPSSGRTVNLDGEDFKLMQMPGITGPVFYPTLISLTGHAFAHIPEGRELKMYTLLCNGRPVPQTTKTVAKYKPGAELLLTDRYYGENYLIAGRWPMVSQWQARPFCEASQQMS